MPNSPTRKSARLLGEKGPDLPPGGRRVTPPRRSEAGEEGGEVEVALLGDESEESWEDVGGEHHVEDSILRSSASDGTDFASASQGTKSDPGMSEDIQGTGEAENPAAADAGAARPIRQSPTSTGMSVQEEIARKKELASHQLAVELRQLRTVLDSLAATAREGRRQVSNREHYDDPAELRDSDLLLTRVREDAEREDKEIAALVSSLRKKVWEAGMDENQTKEELKRIAIAEQEGRDGVVEIRQVISPILEDRQTEKDLAKQASKNISHERLKIPEFSGELTDFPAWKSRWQVGVDSPKTPLVQRLQYLKSHVKGQAASMISYIGDTEADYEKAWDLLNQRYGDKEEQRKAVIEEITARPTPATDMESQRAYHDYITGTYERLVSIDPAVEQAKDGTLQQIIEGKYANRLRKEVWQKLGKEHDLRDFFREIGNLISLEITCRMAGSSPAKHKPKAKGPKGSGHQLMQQGKPGGGSKASPPRTKSQMNQKKGSGQKGGQQKRAGGGGQGAGRSGGGGGGAGKSPSPKKAGPDPVHCHLCKSTKHYITNCPDFRALTVDNRKGKATSLNLCYKCLRKGHSSKECPFVKPCKATQNGNKCGSLTHHTLLHKTSQ